MSTKGKRPMRALTPGDKIEAIQRVNDGESKASVARDIGVPESTLRGWCKNEDKLRYMTSRLSSPETEKSNDGEPPDKLARTVSPATSSPPAPSGLDLTAPSSINNNVPMTTPLVDAPVELTIKHSEPSPTQHPPRERRPDPGASVSMSAISPLSGIGHLPSLSHSHLGLSFNEIATNLTLLAQLNPGLTALSAQSSSLLRSVRNRSAQSSPKPAHNGVLNLNEGNHRSRRHHSDPYRHTSTRSNHHVSGTSSTNQSVDEALWYWLSNQQVMLDFTAQTNTSHSLQHGRTSDPNHLPKSVAATAPLNSHLDYNKNSWLWQYYKQLGGAMSLPEDRHRSAAQVPKDKTAENILYSQLTRGKMEEDNKATTQYTKHIHSRNDESRRRNGMTASEEPSLAQPAVSPEVQVENKETADRSIVDPAKSQTKARTVLDNLLFSKTSPMTTTTETRYENVSNGDWDTGAAEALEHGDKFLSWLEASGDPSVTRMHVHQLRSLMHNLRARHVPPTHTDTQAEHVPRRK